MTQTSSPQVHDVAVIGAGISGLYALKRLRDEGLDAVVLEEGPSVGGTWFWNSYPGARVDIESIEFSYSCDPELQNSWTWSSRYAHQPELLDYLQHVVERYALAEHIRLDARVDAAHFNDATAVWTLTKADGSTLTARHLVLATGALSAPLKPVIPGLDSFAGEVLQSIRWPREGVDLSGRRVGVIGTGATGVQIVTALAPELGADLVVFQRTAPYVVPAHNGPLSKEYGDEIKSDYAAWREAEQEHFGGFVSVDFQIDHGPVVSALEVSDDERRAEFERRWNSGGLSFYSSYPDLAIHEPSNQLLGDFLREKTREQVAGHPQEEAFIPRDYLPLTRRLIVEDGYYESYTQHGAQLVDLRESEDFEVVEGGVMLDGTLVALDVLVLATGFEGVIGAPARMDIRGTGGIQLKDHWRAGPSTLLGFLVDGFPNMYLVNGAGCPGALTQAFTLSEFQVDWIADLLTWAQERDHRTIAASPIAAAAWTNHLAEVLGFTLFPRAKSWYLGSNVEGQQPMPMLYLGGFPAYKRHSLAEKSNGYPNLAFDSDTSAFDPEVQYSL